MTAKEGTLTILLPDGSKVELTAEDLRELKRLQEGK